MPITPDNPPPDPGGGGFGGAFVPSFGGSGGGFAPGAALPIGTTVLGPLGQFKNPMGSFNSFSTFQDPMPREPGSKTPRTGPTPGGGNGGGGGGFGGFGGFGGGGATATRGAVAMGENIPIWMKRMGVGMPAGTMNVQQPQGFAMGGTAGPMMPGVTPGPPQPSDTVDAKVSPNEMVMNNGVTSDPVMQAVLSILNILGALKMHGAMGADWKNPPDMAQGDPDGDGYAFGGKVPGYAFGGFTPQASPFGRPSPWMQRPGTFGAPAQAPGAGRTTPPPLGGSTAGNPGGFGGYTYNPEGGVTNFNPNDPWGAYNQNRDPRVYGQGVRNLGGFGSAGYFDPQGNQALINALNQGAQGTADALVRRQMTATDLAGLDPAQAAVQKLQALRDTGRGVQDIMAQVRGGALQNQNDFAQRLYEQLLGGDLGFTGQTNQTRLQDWLAGNQQARNNKFNLAGLLGQLGGTALGGYLGGRTPQVPIADFGPAGGLGGLQLPGQG